MHFVHLNCFKTDSKSDHQQHYFFCWFLLIAYLMIDVTIWSNISVSCLWFCRKFIFVFYWETKIFYKFCANRCLSLLSLINTIKSSTFWSEPRFAWVWRIANRGLCYYKFTQFTTKLNFIWWGVALTTNLYRKAFVQVKFEFS